MALKLTEDDVSLVALLLHQIDIIKISKDRVNMVRKAGSYDVGFFLGSNQASDGRGGCRERGGDRVQSLAANVARRPCPAGRKRVVSLSGFKRADGSAAK